MTEQRAAELLVEGAALAHGAAPSTFRACASCGEVTNDRDGYMVPVPAGREVLVCEDCNYEKSNWPPMSDTVFVGPLQMWARR